MEIHQRLKAGFLFRPTSRTILPAFSVTTDYRTTTWAVREAKAIGEPMATCTPSATPPTREVTPHIPTTPARVVETRISREHQTRGVRLLQRMPRDWTMTFSWRISFRLDTHPHFPYVSPYKTKRMRGLPTPPGVTSGKVRTIYFLGLSLPPYP